MTGQVLLVCPAPDAARGVTLRSDTHRSLPLSGSLVKMSYSEYVEKQFQFAGVGKLTIRCVPVLSPLDAMELLSGNDLTGLLVWPAADALSKFLCENAHYVEKRDVIELGAGCSGIPGIVSAKLGAAKVVITDGNEESVSLLQHNLSANLPDSPHCTAQALLWDSPPAEFRSAFDAVICSDVVYEREAVAPLLSAVSELLRDSPASVFITALSFRGRDFAPLVKELSATRRLPLQSETTIASEGQDPITVLMFRRAE